MDSGLLNSLQAASNQRPKPAEYKPSYGTAGFRSKADHLSSTVFRCGVLMALRSLKTCKTTGICITASHNPAPDNGVKLVEGDGSMLLQEYEALADELANAVSSEALVDIVKRCIESEGINLSGDGKVLLAYDTRPSGGALAEDAAAGISSLGVAVEVLGVMTTPQLHWAVMRRNQNLDSSEEAYYRHIADAFGVLTNDSNDSYSKKKTRTLHVDCANGVGALKLDKLMPYVTPLGLDFRLYNVGEGVLNGDCGSDFVQKEKTLPETMRDIKDAHARMCAVDGDADRLVYFFPDANSKSSTNTITLLDGDKIAALVAGLFTGLVSKLSSESDAKCNGNADLSKSTVGVVQTAYANGSSTRYLSETLNCEVVVTPTGVKHLHKAAHQFDIGIYFEANGHGTVLFKDSFLDALRAHPSPAAAEILALNDVINEAVGDAISDILLVETALFKRGMDLPQWNALYDDLPSRQLKAEVPDRTAIVTEDAERRVARPKKLQEMIDALVAEYPGGRSFVRPSGTEDIVRIYAEAVDERSAEELAERVREAVINVLSSSP